MNLYVADGNSVGTVEKSAASCVGAVVPRSPKRSAKAGLVGCCCDAVEKKLEASMDDDGAVDTSPNKLEAMDCATGSVTIVSSATPDS